MNIIHKTIASTILMFMTCVLAVAQLHRDTVKVHHYNLQLDMTQSLLGIISGCAELKVSLVAPTNMFAVDLYKLKTDSVIINNRKIEYSSNDSILRIFQSTSFDTLPFKVQIYYHGHPQKDSKWGGFFSDNKMAYNIGVGMGSYPHGIGRYWYPCNDAFTDRATYDFHITTRNTEKAIASGVLVCDSINHDKHYYHWKLNQTIPTYLASIVVGPFICIKDNYTGLEKEIPIELYTLANDSIATVTTFNKLKATTAAFEKRFGPYQWDKIGFSVLSFNQGAMEHVNNIAFPRNKLNNNLKARNLIAHELAHHWFGNLITCSSSTDMWINEGWASYCESVFKEEVYGSQMGHAHTINNQLNVIKTAHLADGGYFALNNISPSITYGSTVYDKGALVVHCLRNYLGDTLFFSSVKELLKQNTYTNISTRQLQAKLSKASGIDLGPFFNNWVYKPGFPHYSVNHFTSEPNDTLFNVDIELRQKLKARQEYSNANRIPLRFIDKNFSYIDTVLTFDGKTEHFKLTLPIKPVAVFTDIHQQVPDVTSDDIKTIKETGYTTFANCDFKLKTNAIQDSALIRVQYNWLPADDFSEPQPKVHISNYHYWKIEGVFEDKMQIEGMFSYNFSTNTNHNINYSPLASDTIVLLYRADGRANWSVLEKGDLAKHTTGSISTNTIKPGEYALAFKNNDQPN